MAAKGCILIADDEPTFLLSTAELLRHAGHECHCASDAFEARRMLEEHTFDLMLCDIRMPGNADLELIEQLPCKVPVILVTGYPPPTDAVQSLQADVVAVLTKPADIDELLGTIQQGLDDERVCRAG
jgi:DNA-binding NtrC family response regulator